MVTVPFVSALRSLVAVLLVSAASVTCSRPAPIVLQPLAPGVVPMYRTSEGQPAPGVRPLMTRARWIVADGAHRGFVGSRESARLIAREESVPDRPASPEEEGGTNRASTPPASTRRVDLNTASLSELDTLPGVGPAIAARIVENRPYDRLGDLQRVRGIGPATLERIRPHAVVEPSAR